LPVDDFDRTKLFLLQNVDRVPERLHAIVSKAEAAVNLAGSGVRSLLPGDGKGSGSHSQTTALTDMATTRYVLWRNQLKGISF
jgi:hypothetical protein